MKKLEILNKYEDALNLLDQYDHQEVEEIKGIVKEEKVSNKEEKSVNNTEGTTDILAPIQGNVIDILVKPNDKVKKGTVLLLIEAMKLENEVNAPRDCQIVDVVVNKGETVSTNQVLVRIK